MPNIERERLAAVLLEREHGHDRRQFGAPAADFLRDTRLIWRKGVKAMRAT